jgi:prolyl-tRNA synthetase
MKMSQLFGYTLREAPAGAQLTSHQLAIRAGLVRFLGAGLYSYLPLGWRVARKIEAILHEEMQSIGAQEMLMPVMHPAELWQATGRWESVGPTMVRVKDRRGHDYAMAMTHEEVVIELARREIKSYRDLPKVVYHIQTKMRDEQRSRGGLLRVREFRMKDAYSLDADVAGLDAFYPRIIDAYKRIFARCDLSPIPVEADTGMMGGADSHEYPTQSKNYHSRCNIAPAQLSAHLRLTMLSEHQVNLLTAAVPQSSVPRFLTPLPPALRTL